MNTLRSFLATIRTSPIRHFRRLANHEFFPFYTFILYLLAFPHFNLWPLAWVALIPYLIFIQREEKLWKLIVLPSVAVLIPVIRLTFGMSYFAIGDYCVFLLFMTLFLVPWTILIKQLLKRTMVLDPPERAFILLLGIPSVWTVYEFIRGSGPLLRVIGGGQLGYSQIYNLAFLQTARWIGVYGVSFLIAMTNVALFLIFSNHHDRKRHFVFPVVAIVIVGVLTVLGFRHLEKGYEVTDTVRVSLIQPNVMLDDFNEEERPVTLEGAKIQKSGKVTTVILDLIKEAAHDKADIIILPERSFPQPIRSDAHMAPGTQKLFARADALNIPIVIGALETQSVYVQYNSAYFISADGTVTDKYFKQVLFPFAEYIPGGYLLERIINEKQVHKKYPFIFGQEAKDEHFSLALYLGVEWLSSGSYPTIFELENGVRFATPICTEDVFPEMCRVFVKKGAQFLAVIANEAWFRRSLMIENHITSAVLRAVENNVAVVRAANTSMSGLILPNGKIADMIMEGEGELKYVRGFITVDVPITRERTLFTKGGHLFPWIVVFLAAFFIFYAFTLSKPE